jgi:hypothetical protein
MRRVPGKAPAGDRTPGVDEGGAKGVGATSALVAFRRGSLQVLRELLCGQVRLLEDVGKGLDFENPPGVNGYRDPFGPLLAGPAVEVDVAARLVKHLEASPLESLNPLLASNRWQAGHQTTTWAKR